MGLIFKIYPVALIFERTIIAGLKLLCPAMLSLNEDLLLAAAGMLSLHESGSLILSFLPIFDAFGSKLGLGDEGKSPPIKPCSIICPLLAVRSVPPSFRY